MPPTTTSQTGVVGGQASSLVQLLTIHLPVVEQTALGAAPAFKQLLLFRQATWLLARQVPLLAVKSQNGLSMAQSALNTQEWH
jgi:hypothetical protein